MPTFVDIAGGPKGDDLNKQIKPESTPASSRPCSTASISAPISKATSDKSARDTFFYYSNSTPSAVRYKNWKMYYTMTPTSPTGAMQGKITYGWTMVDNIRRDPFEIAGG